MPQVKCQESICKSEPPLAFSFFYGLAGTATVLSRFIQRSRFCGSGQHGCACSFFLFFFFFFFGKLFQTASLRFGRRRVCKHCIFIHAACSLACRHFVRSAVGDKACLDSPHMLAALSLFHMLFVTEISNSVKGLHVAVRRMVKMQLAVAPRAQQVSACLLGTGFHKYGYTLTWSWPRLCETLTKTCLAWMPSELKDSSRQTLFGQEFTRVL